LQLEVLEPASWKRTFKIKLPPEKLQSHIENTFAEYRKKTKLPGFRPGRVSKEVLQSRFKERIERDAVETLVPEVFSEAIKQSGLSPLTDGVLDDIKVQPDKSVDLTITFEILPAIRLARYKGIPVTREVKKVSPEDIERRLEALRESIAEFVPGDGPAQRGDLAVIDYVVGNKAGKELSRVDAYSVHIGSGDVLPALEEALLGLKTGDSRNIDVTYPADYPRSDLAGQEVTIAFKVKETKGRRLPPLDDNLAISLGRHQTLAELRAQVRVDLEKEAEEKADAAVHSDILKTILKESPFEIPQSMVERFLAALTRGRQVPGDEEPKFRETFVPVATEQIRRNLVIEEIARLEHIECTAQDVEAHLQKIADASHASLEMVRDKLERENRLSGLRSELRDRKVLELLAREAVYPQKRRFGLWG
jgi:trigger factor